MTNPPNIDAIIAELSEAQRVIIAQKMMGASTHRFYPRHQHRACRTLAAAGALTESQDNIGNPMFAFTPLGLAVRSALIGEVGRDG